MSTRRRYRFRAYTVRPEPDPASPPGFAAVCVTGGGERCGAASGELDGADELVRWIAAHCAHTGHERYERTVRETVRAEPGAWQ